MSDLNETLEKVINYGLPSPTRPSPPNAITFTSQEDFENAVMEVIMKRLCIHSHEAYIQVGDFGSSC